VTPAAKKSGPKKDFHSLHPHLFPKDGRDFRGGRDNPNAI